MDGAANTRAVAGAGTAEDALVEAMVAYQRGTMEAFETIYGALARPLKGYLRVLARDGIVADDLLQETFLQLHRVRHTYDPGRPVKPWVYAIARNVFLMHRRASSRRGRHEVIADDELPDVPVPPDLEVLGNAPTLRKALASLPDARREPLVLHHILGMSFKEVGAALGISEGAAKVRAHRALRELRMVIAVPRGGS
jgi:RNA polymerase sigma-70 factor (ECF subfamily)